MTDIRKVIVTTTINPPTEALKRFIEIGREDGWILCIVGDRKTPHALYEKLDDEHEHVFYLSPEMQQDKFPELSEAIGWNCIQRRNLGLIWAHQVEADIVATVDDDNIPLEGWGRDLVVGTEAEVELFTTDNSVFDPIAPFGFNFWHRGFPIQLLATKNDVQGGKRVSRRWLVQADLWNGDPDVDAIGRIALHPEVEFPEREKYSSDKIAPFNSQNTFIHKDAFPTYFLFPHIGRMDDIFAAYVLQHQYPGCVAFGRASVFQDRNEHNLAKDLEAELLGYKHSLNVATEPADWEKYLPAEALKAYELYQKAFE